MRVNNVKHIKVPILIFEFIVVLFFGCNDKISQSGNYEIQKAHTADDIETEVTNNISMGQPNLTDSVFVCNDCHADLIPDSRRKVITDMHNNIIAIFYQDNANNHWCLNCHDLNSRDSLKLAGGQLLAYKESHNLCSQCHGEKVREWEIGVHGKKLGAWNEEKVYLLRLPNSTSHTPKFNELTPDPPPIRQEDIK